MEWRALLAVARRPRLWAEAGRALLAVVPSGWWRRPPYLPRREPAHRAWRLETAYGRADAPLRGEDVVAFLQWRRRLRKASR